MEHITRSTGLLMRRFLRWLLTRERGFKRVVVLFTDLLLCVVAVWLAFSLRLGEWRLFTPPVQSVLLATVLLFPPIFFATGTYRNIFRFAGAGTIAQLALAVTILTIPLIAIFTVQQVPGVPRTIAFLFPLLFVGLLSVSRIVARYMLVDIAGAKGATGDVKKTLIYGAGATGQQLAASLKRNSNFALVGFVDDDFRLAGQKLAGATIYDAARLDQIVARHDVDTVLLALQGINRARRREIVEKLRAQKVHVQILPSLDELVRGEISVSDFREIQVTDLLGRDPVAPNELLLGRTIVDKTVMVTGAGGSIGSELCRQIVALRPKRLVLAEMSEPALYLIERELQQAVATLNDPPDIVPEMLNVADAASTRRIFARWRPDTVFHAAAYKHVPLVEANVISGLRNNVLGTRNAAWAARSNGASHFILISTDKAVRPTNVMGASKRICELVLQALARESGPTRFAMVRFGNVLGSSGSVVPRFEQQIRDGGPVTVTHRDITRFFMTIPEAAQLVIQAGAMAQGGEVFLLDMGKPVRIFDLARSMIELSGRTVRDVDNPNGEIEIVEIGLRPGEKLYEELLIDDRSEKTHHVRIMRAQESFYEPAFLFPRLERLEAALDQGDTAAAMGLLRELVPEYNATGGSLAAAGDAA